MSTALPRMGNTLSGAATIAMPNANISIPASCGEEQQNDKIKRIISTSNQWRSDDFLPPPPTICLGPWPRGYGDYFFLAGPGGPLQPRGPPAVAGPAGPSLRHCVEYYTGFEIAQYIILINIGRRCNDRVYNRYISSIGLFRKSCMHIYVQCRAYIHV